MSLKNLSLGDSEDQILKACTQNDLLTSDRISNLPDDILIRIISSLTLKEAGRTGVLSKRWTHVWTYVPRLNFDASEVLHDIKRKPEIHEEAKYLRWLDQLLSSHKAHAIDEFRVNFQFQNHPYDKYDNWLRFAMQKRVKRLELNIIPLGFLNFNRISYTLPSLTPWNSLTSLELVHIDLTGDVLQKFLSDCPNLELLSVTLANSLLDLKVVDPLNLKSLQLLECRLRSLEISAPNLISFHYCGNKISWPLKNTPKLTELHVESFYANYLLSDSSPDLSSCSTHLEVLILETTLCCLSVSKLFPVAPRLKVLQITICPRSDEELFGLCSLIKSCPLLHKFAVELFELCRCDLRMTRKTRQAEVIPHHNVKILEIKDFTGCNLAMGFAMHLIKTFVSVEKITVAPDRCCLTAAGVKMKAEQLLAVAKPGTKLEICGPAESRFHDSILDSWRK